MVQLKIRFLAMALILLAAVSFPTANAFGQAREDIDAMIGAAKTAADHEAIAAYYDREAKDATSKAGLHRKMAAVYGEHREGYAKELKPLPAHCERIAKRFDSIAKDASELAAIHRKMAKEASH
jgi:hypothetical protein